MSVVDGRRSDAIAERRHPLFLPRNHCIMAEEDPNKKRKLDSSSVPADLLEESHLQWTTIQGHCLTGGGRAEELYTPERGFSFDDSELPHYHLQIGDTHKIFAAWKESKPPASLVTGAWNRPLFCGGWHHTTDKDERVYNLQSHNLFVDLRIPRSREQVIPSTAKSLDDLSPKQLRLYARQHVFAGFSIPSEEKGQSLCTRHHCIDWNFVGQRRPRPNKWWIHMNESKSQWKESSYATDERGQYYYFERWERYPNSDPDGPRVALRISQGGKRDGVFVLVGDHFNYVLARELTGREKSYGQGSLVALVDAAVDAGDLKTAKSYLSIEAGHGTRSSGWKLDCAIPPWNEGKTLAWDRTTIEVGHLRLSDVPLVAWGGDVWDVLDSSFESVDELVSFLMS